MKENTAPPKKAASVKTPRLKDQEYTVVSARIPRAQAEWLEEQAVAGFRGRSDQLAWVIHAAYQQAKSEEP